jgi:cell division protein FtsL
MSTRSLAAGLLLLVVLSAVGAVYAKHESRRLFIEFQALQSERDRYETERGRLQLELGTLADAGEIDRVAAEMGMIVPAPQAVVYVRP